MRRFFGATLLLAAALACSGPSDADLATQSTGTDADSADHVMFKVRTVLTNLGVKQADMKADTAFMYETAGRTELRKVELTFFSTTGIQQSVLTANAGTYMFRAQTMEARGLVTVVKSDGSRLRTSILRFDQAKQEVTTDQPYTYESQGRVVQGSGFTSDPSFSNISSRNVSGSGGGFRLPGN